MADITYSTEKTVVTGLLILTLIGGVHASEVNPNQVSTNNGLVAEYRFDTGVGDIAYDTSGGTVHGIRKGYDSDNLNFHPNQWGGSSNNGELDITCPSGDSNCKFTHKGQTYSGDEVNNINNGIATDGQDKGIRYIMYSRENVHDRFNGNPHSSNADHFIAVNYDNGWEYDGNDNGGDTGFSPRSSDLLIAEFNGDGTEDSGNEGSITYVRSQDSNSGNLNGATWKGGDKVVFNGGSREFEAANIGEDFTEFTVSYFAEPQNDQSYGVLRVDGEGDSLIANRLGSSASFYLRTIDGSKSGYIGGLSDVPVDKPVHVVLWWNGQETRTYLNGDQRASTTFSPTSEFSMDNIAVGHTIGNGLTEYEGSMRDLRVYSKALSDAEIKSIGNSGSWKVSRSSEDQDPSKVLDMSFQHVQNGQVLDTSGESNHANIVNGASQLGAVECKVGRCFSFDESGNGQYVEADPASGLSDSEITAMAWIKPKPSADARAPIIRADQFYFQHYNDNRLATYWYGWNKEGYHTSPSGSVPTGEWSHVAVTWDDSDGVSFYVDGQLTNQISNTGPGDALSWIRIGREGSGRRFNGKIDQAKVFSRSLSSQEIWEHYTKGRDRSSSGRVGAVAHYPILNGEELVDTAGNNNGDFNPNLLDNSGFESGSDSTGNMHRIVTNNAGYSEVNQEHSKSGDYSGKHIKTGEDDQWSAVVWDLTSLESGKSYDFGTWYKCTGNVNSQFDLNINNGTGWNRVESIDLGGYTCDGKWRFASGESTKLPSGMQDTNRVRFRWQYSTNQGTMYVDDMYLREDSADYVDTERGKVLEFDGDDQVGNIPLSNLMKDEMAKSGSIAIWVNPEGPGDIYNAEPKRPRLIADPDNSQLEWVWFDSSGLPYGDDEVRIPNVPRGEWSHITTTWNGQTGDWAVYRDGEIIKSGDNFNPTTFGWDGRQFCFGAYCDHDVSYFEGKIDQAKIYPYALNQQQVKQVMNSGSVSMG